MRGIRSLFRAFRLKEPNDDNDDDDDDDDDDEAKGAACPFVFSSKRRPRTRTF